MPTAKQLNSELDFTVIRRLVGRGRYYERQNSINPSA
jgi:hypothetical protein